MAKARTKLELEVTALSQQLPKITKTQKEWIHFHSLNHLGFATKTRVICMDCGETFSPKIVSRKKAVCPCCKTKVKIVDTKKRTDYQNAFNAIATVYKRYQIIRYFETHANYKKGMKSMISTREVMQFWINPEGKLTMLGHIHDLGWCGDSWQGDWSIRKKYYSCHYHNKYDLYPEYYLPGSKFLRKYTKKGINRNLYGISFIDAIDIVEKHTQAETLIKAKQYGLLSKMVTTSGSSVVIQNWASIKIALRNKYKVEDTTMWLDYLEMLREFGKDIRSPKYVCVKDVKKEHDRYLVKHQKREAKKQLEEKARRIEEDEIRYFKNKKPYIGLSFKQDNIKVSFLNTVKDVMEEGSVLKHCVWSSNYHKKNSLLFSATIKNKKIATVEVDPVRLEIIQIRGEHNSPTKYDKEILNIVNKNMNKIRRCKNTIKRSRKKRELVA